MTEVITSIVDKALLQARGCILGSQATEAGHLFGSDLVEGKSNPDCRAAIQAALAEALVQTAPGSRARAFMIAVLSALDDTWGRLP